LAREQRQWEMLEAANAQASARVFAHVPGVPNHDLDVTLREVSKRLRAERAAKKVQM
jgi:HSP20 family molecular chaperone IbpA